MTKSFIVLLACGILLGIASDAVGAKRRKRYRSRRPHPIFLWSKTLSTSTDLQKRKRDAFKLSKYSLSIHHTKIIDTLLNCINDKDRTIQVFCTIAIKRAEKKSYEDKIRDALLDLHEKDPEIRATVIRTLIARKEHSQKTQTTLLNSAKTSEDSKHLLALLHYFETFGTPDKVLVPTLNQIYYRAPDDKVKIAVIKTLSSQAKGQSDVLGLFSECAQSDNTPLALTCLDGLEVQAKDDPRVWKAVEKTIESSDPDVLLSTLDVINALPDRPNAKLSGRLLSVVDNVKEQDLREKAVLGIGEVGDKSEKLIARLEQLFKEDEDEGVRVAAALILGEQGTNFPKRVKPMLKKCAKHEKSRPLKTACELGIHSSGK